MAFDRIPNTQYFCQSVNIPGLTIGTATLNYSGLDISAPNDKIEYGQLNMSFTIDEAMQSWKDLHSWFRSIASPKGTDERNRLSVLQSNRTTGPKVYSDATLTVLSALNNPLFRVRYYNCFPISLSDIEFDTKSSADDILTGSATFMFDYFDFDTV